MRFPRIRFHLTTCLLAMIVGSALLGMNLRTRQIFHGDGRPVRFPVWGWPIPFGFVGERMGDDTRAIRHYYGDLHGAWNVLLNAAMFLGPTLACEWVLRRRDQRRPSAAD